MKHHSIIIASLAFFAMLFGPAHATTVDFSYNGSGGGWPIDVFNLNVGQSGNIDVNYYGGARFYGSDIVSGSIHGSLSPKSVMTLTYSIDPLTWYGHPVSVSQIAYYDDSLGEGYEMVSSDVPSDPFSNYVYGSAAPLVFSTTEVTGPNLFKIVLKNLSAYYASFFSEVSGYAQWLLDEDHPWHLTGTYSVASAVPLPAALPLFGVGLTALAAGAARRRKAIQNATA